LNRATGGSARSLPGPGRVARFAVAGGLTAYLFWKSHPRDVLAAAAGADWPPIAVAVLLVFVDRALMAYRWVVLLNTLDPADRPPLPEILRVFFVSTFIGSFLPSVGGDAVRAYAIAKGRMRGEDAVASVFMDRMLGVASLLLMALAGLVLARELARDWVILASIGFAALACTVTLLLVFSERAAAFASLLFTRFPLRAKPAAERTIGSIQRYSRHHAPLVAVLAASVVVQAIRVLQAYYLGRGLGIDVGPASYFAVVPVILLVMLLPVTVNGLGTGQAAFVWFFAPFGVTPSAAFTLSLLFIALGLVGNLPGGILYALGPGSSRVPRYM
jgi:glycosyltransferase 2 family protein